MRRIFTVSIALVGMLALGFVVDSGALAQSARSPQPAASPHSTKHTTPAPNVPRLQTTVNRLLGGQDHMIVGNTFSIDRRSAYSQTLNNLWTEYARTNPRQIFQQIRTTAQLRKIVDHNLLLKQT